MPIATCRTTHPDLVITDLKMPDGDEGTAMEAIWLDEPTPVIGISAFPQDLPESLRVSPLLIAVLVKPIKTTDLEPVISRITAGFHRS